MDLPAASMRQSPQSGTLTHRQKHADAVTLLHFAHTGAAREHGHRSCNRFAVKFALRACVQTTTFAQHANPYEMRPSCPPQTTRSAAASRVKGIAAALTRTQTARPRRPAAALGSDANAQLIRRFATNDAAPARGRMRSTG